jgi:hypothetical protein
MPCPSHPPWLHHSNYIWRRVHKLWSTSLRSFLQLSITSSFFGPNILNTLFSNTLSRCLLSILKILLIENISWIVLYMKYYGKIFLLVSCWNSVS